MSSEHEASLRGEQAAERAAELRERHDKLAAGEPVTAADVEFAERRAEEARERAGYAGLSAARSLNESARLHEEVAQVQDLTIAQGASRTEVHERSAARHRKAAETDRMVAERKINEAKADLRPGTD